MSGKKANIVEIFGPTIQGEGPLIGKKAFFVRFAGCPYRCSWCDTPYAVLSDQIRENVIQCTADEILDKLQDLGATTGNWIILTGGDPVLWGEPIYDLITKGRAKFKFQVETQGSLWQEWLTLADLVVVSPKPPSSGMANKFDIGMLREYAAALGEKLNIKVVIFEREDFEWTKILRPMFSDTAFYLSVGTSCIGLDNYTEHERSEYAKSSILQGLKTLSNEILKTPEFNDVTLLPQLHVLTWGTKRGV